MSSPGSHVRSSNVWSLGDRSIGPSEPCFVIAEAGVNHGGDLDQAVARADQMLPPQAPHQMTRIVRIEKLDIAQYARKMRVEMFELLARRKRRVRDVFAGKALRLCCANLIRQNLYSHGEIE